MNTHSFLAALKRRSVYKVATAYAVIAWLVIQVASVVFPAFNAPPWLLKITIFLVALGFPLAVVLAWAFDITPEGIKRSEDLPRDQQPARRKSRKLVGVTLLAAGSRRLAAHARLGENDRALELLQRLLKTPGPVMPFFEASITLSELRTRWQWAELRKDPRLQKILADPEPATVY